MYFFTQVANSIDRAVAGSVDFDNVQANRPWIHITIKLLSKQACHGRFTDTSGSRK